MPEREIHELMVQHEKATQRLVAFAQRALDALEACGPVLTEVGNRLGARDRLLYAERIELWGKIQAARRRVVEIMDGKEEELQRAANEAVLKRAWDISRG